MPVKKRSSLNSLAPGAAAGHASVKLLPHFPRMDHGLTRKHQVRSRQPGWFSGSASLMNTNSQQAVYPD